MKGKFPINTITRKKGKFTIKLVFTQEVRKIRALFLVWKEENNKGMNRNQWSIISTAVHVTAFSS